MKSKMLALVLVLLALPSPLAAQTSAEVSAAERAQFGHGQLRQGADGNNPDAPNYANFDPARVGDLQIVWNRQKVPASVETLTEHIAGQILSPSGSMGPVIDGTLTLPDGAQNVPIVIEYTYI